MGEYYGASQHRAVWISCFAVVVAFHQKVIEFVGVGATEETVQVGFVPYFPDVNVTFEFADDAVDPSAD